MRDSLCTDYELLKEQLLPSLCYQLVYPWGFFEIVALHMVPHPKPAISIVIKTNCNIIYHDCNQPFFSHRIEIDSVSPYNSSKLYQTCAYPLLLTSRLWLPLPINVITLVKSVLSCIPSHPFWTMHLDFWEGYFSSRVHTK